MEIELNSNENLFSASSCTCDSFSNQNHEIQQKPLNVNAMLNCLIEKYSLNKVMNRIIFLMTFRGKENNINGDLDLVIEQILDREGSLNIIKAILESKIDEDKEGINASIKINKENKIKQISSLPSNKVKEKFIPIHQDNKNINNKSSNSNEDSTEIIILEDDESRNNKNNKDKKIANDIIIDINDNYINKENKKEENDEIIDLKYNKLNSSNYIEINSNNDYANKTSKTKRRFASSQISYHCSVIYGYYYKYYKKFQYKNNFFFQCDNPECNGCGIYNKNDKTFRLIDGHLFGNSINCYKKLMNEQDYRNFRYMKKYKVNEIQMYNDENDEI